MGRRSEGCILMVIVIGHYFHLYFLSIFNPTSPYIPYPTFLLYVYLHYVFFFSFFMSFTLMNKQQEHNSIVQLVTEQLVYWATNIPKQSCCGSSSPGSCAGTSSTATKHSHHSKFQTSRTQSMSRSVSTTRRLLVIERFLATTAARLP